MSPLLEHCSGACPSSTFPSAPCSQLCMSLLETCADRSLKTCFPMMQQLTIVLTHTNASNIRGSSRCRSLSAAVKTAKRNETLSKTARATNPATITGRSSIGTLSLISRFDVTKSSSGQQNASIFGVSWSISIGHCAVLPG